MEHSQRSEATAMAQSEQLSPLNSQHGGRYKVTTSQGRPKTRFGHLILNALGLRPGNGMELWGMRVTALPSTWEMAPM